MNDKITEIKKVMSEATSGPWEYEFYEEMADVYPAIGTRLPICQMWMKVGKPMKNSENNADFIAKSPEYITYLLQLVETQSKALKFYADPANYTYQTETNEDEPELLEEPIMADDGQKAREALSII